MESGELTARVRGALWWEREHGVEQVEGLMERRRIISRGRFSAGAVKVMQDGVAENYTAAMTGPYLDGCGCRTGNTGLSFVDPAVLREGVIRLDAEGFQVHVHAIGDRAVREALDAFEATRAANGSNDLRHHIAHLQVVHPDDRARFAELDVIANMQPLWAELDEQMTDLTIRYLEDERVDWPVSTPEPLRGIHMAVNRWGYDEPGRAGSEPFLPEHALTLSRRSPPTPAGRPS